MKTVHGINRFVGFKKLYCSASFERFLDEYPEARKRWDSIRPILDRTLTQKQVADVFHLSERTIRRWLAQYEPKNWYSLLPASRCPLKTPRRRTPMERYGRVVNIANKELSWGAPLIQDYIAFHDPLHLHISERTVSRILKQGLARGDIKPRRRIRKLVTQRRDIRGRTIKRVQNSTKEMEKPGERVNTDGVIVHIYDAGRQLLRKLYFSCSLDRFSRIAMVTAGETMNADLTIENHGKIRTLLGEPIEEVVNDGGPENLGDSIEYYEGENIIQSFTFPHSPKQNAVIERFNRTFQEECLLGRCLDLTQPIGVIQEEINAWLVFYNTKRPHQALGGIPPILQLFLWKLEKLPFERKTDIDCGHMLWRGTGIVFSQPKKTLK